MSYKKYNLFKQLENEIIITDRGYLLQYQDRLFEYDNNNNIINKTNINSLSISDINNLIKKAKQEGDIKKYKITYFNLCKKELELAARSKEQAELKFGRLFDLDILDITCKTV